MYATDLSALVEAVNSMEENEVVNSYPNAALYLTNLLQRKEEWAKLYRNNAIIRGSDTNNYVEAQFLVLKDTILRRTRQFNVNALLVKIFEDFMEHFKFKLFSIADNSFDGIFSRRFKGYSKNKNSGFIVPAVDVQNDLLKRTISLGQNLFLVPSKSTESVYQVDMSIGICDCYIGSDGSPCSHQYLL